MLPMAFTRFRIQHKRLPLILVSQRFSAALEAGFKTRASAPEENCLAALGGQTGRLSQVILKQSPTSDPAPPSPTASHRLSL
jgi:hypothetical protein